MEFKNIKYRVTTLDSLKFVATFCKEMHLKLTCYDIMAIKSYPYICFFADETKKDKFHLTQAAASSYAETRCKEVSLQEFLRTLLIMKPNLSTNVILNEDYTAEVFVDRVVVGCQTFSIEQIKQILNEAEKLQ